MRGMPAVARLLMSRGASLDDKNAAGLNALDVARRANQPNVVTAIEEEAARRA